MTELNTCNCGQFIDEDQVECQGCYLSRTLTRSRAEILADMEKLNHTWRENKDKLDELGKELEEYHKSLYRTKEDENQ